MSRPQDEQGEGYSRRLLEALIMGEVARDRTEHLPAEDVETWPREELTWSHLRATIERTGNLESKAVSLVLDLERALLALSTQHPEAASAVVTQLMLEPEASTLHQVYNVDRRGRPVDPERWIRKSVAWMSAYLSGLPVSADKGKASCEAAWRRAR